MFITIEGPEGSGKTTAVNTAVKKLEELGYQIVRTREPGGTPIAEQISATELSLPMYYGMLNEEIQYVIDIVNEFKSK